MAHPARGPQKFPSGGSSGHRHWAAAPAGPFASCRHPGSMSSPARSEASGGQRRHGRAPHHGERRGAGGPRRHGPRRYGRAPAAPAPYLNEPRPARRDLHGGLPPPAAEIRRPRRPRTVATWVCQAGNEPLQGYFSAAAWSGQVQCEVGLQLDRVPQVFRGRTLADHGAAFPGGVATPDPGARYCAICGLLVVAAEYHETSERHKAAVEAARAARAAATGPRRAPAAASAAAALDVDTVRARMRADPAFAAAILAPAAAGAGSPAGFAAAVAAVSAGDRGPGGAFAAGVASPSAGAAESSPMDADGPVGRGAAVDLLGPAAEPLVAGFAPPPAEPNLATQDSAAFLKMLDDFSRR
ncbi:hypothetical protein HPB48_000771 [Haemaphysalis longicornis]|uniref:Uncharacterized protein n=1 Tax=Haemaphysalis longicornis TaxID=44386 RepID=A0A9J6GAC6_HAELO|nr:hypothetical protein HPB48_000771 [Haemaphysalis longicornis]